MDIWCTIEHFHGVGLVLQLPTLMKYISPSDQKQSETSAMIDDVHKGECSSSHQYLRSSEEATLIPTPVPP